MIDREKELRLKVLDSITRYSEEIYEKKREWKEGDKIPYAGRCFDRQELLNLANATMDFWLTSGKYCDEFESELAKYLGVKYCLLTNSGSSSNLLAFSALTSPKLGDRQIKKGDEVITVAAGFPTTIAPIIQYGAVPVFVDMDINTANIDTNELEKAISDKTKAIMIAHTLGNPFNLKAVKEFCNKHNLWLVEDNCDALGAKYNLNGEWKYTGTIGDIGTSSFYPAHHMTMGEGGAVYTDNPLLNKILLSIRDWGRDCFCKSGCDNTCKKRFSLQFGELPYGYDHKYVYSHWGYNLKATEMQAAIGVAQLEKLTDFIDARKNNFKLLKEGLKELDKHILIIEDTKDSEPSPFGFLMTVKNIKREDVLEYLQGKGIQTRLLFAGNITKQPLFDEIRGDFSKYRVIGELNNTETIMNSSFFIGVYPGMSEEMINYMIDSIKEFFN